jgi:2-iminobutanoate/2-iminopropanoate deaminase
LIESVALSIRSTSLGSSTKHGDRRSQPASRQAPDALAAQTEAVIENIRRVLEAAGASLANVVKTTVYLEDASAFPEFDDVYRRCFAEPQPARTTLGASLAHVRGALTAMDAIAAVEP